MEFIFLAHAVLTLAIAIFLIFHFFKHYQKEKLNKIITWFSFISFGYILLSVMFILWFFSVINYNAGDFLVIYSLVIVVQTLLFFRTSYLLCSNKSIFYLLFIYLLCMLSVFLSISQSALLIITASLFITLILCINFLSSLGVFRPFAYAGIIYCCISLIFQFLLFFGIGEELFFSLVSNSFFFVLSLFFLRNAGSYPLNFSEKACNKNEPYIFLFFKYLVFVIVITNIILIGTIGIHEFGHVTVSKIYGCQYKTILYEEGSYPYTELFCASHRSLIVIAGVLFPLIVAVFMFFVSGKLMRELAMLVVGFDLLAAFRDFQDIGISENLVITSSIMGVIFVLIGIILLAKSRMEERRLLVF